MKQSKYIFIVFFILLIGKGGWSQTERYRPEIKVKKWITSESKSVSNDTQNEIPYFKKKYKLKGLQCVVPKVPDLECEIYHYCSDFSWPIFKKRNPVLFVYFVKCKRGPPVV